MASFLEWAARGAAALVAIAAITATSAWADPASPRPSRLKGGGGADIRVSAPIELGPPKVIEGRIIKPGLTIVLAAPRHPSVDRAPAPAFAAKIVRDAEAGRL